MKPAAIIFIYLLNHCLCEDKRLFVKSHPKKVQFGKLELNPKTLVKLKKHGNPDYTVFPAVAANQKVNIPDSPYFLTEPLPDEKTRIKKVLPDYIWSSLRSKRSVVGEKGVNKEVKVKNDIKAGNKSRSHHSRRRSKNRHNSKNKRRGNKQPVKYTKRDKRKRNKVARRLITGRDALIEDYPYVVSIQKDGQHWCSGSLLNTRLVITTANCLWKSKRISRMQVRAGSRYVDREGQMANIQEVMKHPGWSIRRGPDYDVALILLDRNIRFSDHVHGVDLPNQVMVPAFNDAWVTSWGSERRDGTYDSRSTALQVYHAQLLDHDKCNNITQRFGVTVSENFICLAQTGKRAPCTRDTGAPAVSDGILWGMASWGIRKLCGTERFPAMFSYLASLSNLNFIINATHYLMADHRHNPFLDVPPYVKVTTITQQAMHPF